MPNNRIPRHRDGSRNWFKLCVHERLILAAIYRTPGRTADEIAAATGLTRGAADAALSTLTDPARGHALGCRGAVLEPCARPRSEDGYHLTPEWLATGRAPRWPRRAAA